MRFVPLLALFIMVPLAEAIADPIVAKCPSEWTFGGQTLPLLWANTWADDEVIDNNYGESEEIPGRAISRIDMSKVNQRPL
ncbi:MAG: hypothetical protein ACM3Q1_16210 [Bacteroidales bacterium]